MRTVTGLIVLTQLIAAVTAAYATKVCPKCGREYPDDYNFCEECIPPTRLVGGTETTAEENETGEKEVGPGIKLVKIPGGTFSMGSTTSDGEGDESPVHEVQVYEFWLAETEVTNAQYCAFLNAVKPTESERKKWIAIKNDLDTKERKNWYVAEIKNSGGTYYPSSGYEDHPVICVNWYGADAFCDHYGLRLPTEAEWEYVAGGPEHYKYPWGNSWQDNRCCYDRTLPSSNLTPVPTEAVGSYYANGYGLYDIAGNVWEWCSDWYGEDYYKTSPPKNPKGPSVGDYKVLRGGSWYNDLRHVRCAGRICDDPENLICLCGFRAAAGD
jgi:formylglycine-generating enzyme required for sulfatase activity